MVAKGKFYSANNYNRKQWVWDFDFEFKILFVWWLLFQQQTRSKISTRKRDSQVREVRECKLNRSSSRSSLSGRRCVVLLVQDGGPVENKLLVEIFRPLDPSGQALAAASARPVPSDMRGFLVIFSNRAPSLVSSCSSTLSKKAHRGKVYLAGRKPDTKTHVFHESCWICGLFCFWFQQRLTFASIQEPFRWPFP